jgi:hypothetical protein
MAQVDQEVIFSILNGMGIPLPQFFREDGTPVKMSGNVAPWFELKDSNIMQQTDMQRRFQKTIATQSNTSVLPNTYNMGTYIDTNGFDEIHVISNIDASVANSIDLHWSHDGVNMHLNDSGVGGTTAALTKYGTMPTKARFVKVNIKNSDAAAHIMSAWLYLKV